MVEFTTNEVNVVNNIFSILYQEAETEHREYAPSSFWQAIFQWEFPLWKGFISSAEQPPDDSLRRVDCIVRRLSTNTILSALVVVEYKSTAKSAKEVENQALDAAIKVVGSTNLPAVYAFTTIGTSWRAWIVKNGENVLEAIDDAPGRNKRSSYSPALQGDGRLSENLRSNFELMRTEYSLITPRIVPSQAPYLSGPSNYEQPGDLQQQSLYRTPELPSQSYPEPMDYEQMQPLPNELQTSKEDWSKRSETYLYRTDDIDYVCPRAMFPKIGFTCKVPCISAEIMIGC